MKKEEITTRVVNECNVSRNAAKQIVECVIDTIRESCQNGEDVTLRGFGTFKVVTKSARKARNLSTGEEVLVAAHKAVKFKPTPKFAKEMKKLR